MNYQQMKKKITLRDIAKLADVSAATASIVLNEKKNQGISQKTWDRVKKIAKMSYDKNNIFAKILRGEIPCKKVYENDHVLAFHDINPQKKVHVLVIPKGEYVDLDDFNNKASDKEIVELNKAVTHVANLMGSKDKGYRALTNIGSDGGQEVPHLHFHIFAGEKIGKMVT